MEEELLKALIGKTRPRKNYVEANSVDEGGNYYMDKKAQKAQEAGSRRKVEIIPEEKLSPPKGEPLNVEYFTRSQKDTPGDTSYPIPRNSNVSNTPAINNPTPAPEVAAPEIKERSPASSSWDWGNLAVALAPVIAGYASGAPDVGFSKGGEGLISRYQNEIELNKAKAQALRSKGSDKGRFQARTYEQDGKTYLGTYDTSTGEWVEDEDPRLAGYKQTVRTDPTTEELSIVSGAGGVREVRGARPNPRRTVKEEKELRDVRNRLLKDDKFRAARSTINSTGRAVSLLSANNPIADEGIKTIFPRMFGEVGNLAVSEQERFSGSPALSRKYEKLKQKFLEGTLTDADRRDLMEVARVMQEYDKRNLREAANSFIRSEKSLSGVDASEVIDPFLQESVPSARGTVSRARKADPTKGKPEIVRQSGFTYKLNANGEYEPVED